FTGRCENLRTRTDHMAIGTEGLETRRVPAFRDDLHSKFLQKVFFVQDCESSGFLSHCLRPYPSIQPSHSRTPTIGPTSRNGGCGSPPRLIAGCRSRALRRILAHSVHESGNRRIRQTGMADPGERQRLSPAFKILRWNELLD